MMNLKHCIYLQRFHFVLFKRYFTIGYTRFSQNYNFAKLENKRFISITGPDSAYFLQGLITNDVRHLLKDESTSVTLPCIYSFMLTNTGRIITDLFIYKFSDDSNNLILLEVDEQICSSLTKLLKYYKIKRKISINYNNEFKSFVLFPDVSENAKNQPFNLNDWNSKTIITQDPRSFYFGYKMISIQSSNSKDFMINLMIKSNSNFSRHKIYEVDEARYRSFRYQYGIGEGIADFPAESSFPLEANGDILNGISFHKGCYVGQELTARTYHTGVIRKRIMPIKILDVKFSNSNDSLPTQNIIDGQGKTIGRFRTNFREQGLALLKFDSLTNETKIKLNVSGHQIRTWRPFWWPDSIVKQKIELSPN